MTCELRSISLAGAASVSVHFDGYELPFLNHSGGVARELPFGSFTFYPPLANVRLVKHASIRRYPSLYYALVLLTLHSLCIRVCSFSVCAFLFLLTRCTAAVC